MRVEMEVRGSSVTILETRPPWEPGATEWSRQPIGQLRYDPSTTLWTLYWADSNDRWHLYERIGPGRVDALLDEIDTDPLCVFWA
jgi:hypothetical protein